MYKCKGCGKKFRQLRNIKNHIRLKDDDIHGRYNNYDCKFETLKQEKRKQEKREDEKPKFEEINMPEKKEESKKDEEKENDNWYKFHEFSDSEAFQDVIDELEEDGYSEMNIETGEVR